MNKEQRVFSFDHVEIRAKDDGTRQLRGHAAVFNKLSENLGGFREQIEPGAFSDVLDDDVRALFNHDPNMILGRTESGTLSIDQDKTGLSYAVDLPDTSYASDLAVSIDRQDVNQSSFGFTVKDDDWDENEDGVLIRTIKKIGRLFDVSPVTFPAYPDATVGMRSMDHYIQQRGRYKNDLLRKRLVLQEMGFLPGL